MNKDFSWTKLTGQFIIAFFLNIISNCNRNIPQYVDYAGVSQPSSSPFPKSFRNSKLGRVVPQSGANGDKTTVRVKTFIPKNISDKEKYMPITKYVTITLTLKVQEKHF